MRDIYITFVTSARNDSHRPNRAEIQNFSLNFLLAQLNEHQIPSEIIIVEWNYPEDRPPLAETIQIKQKTPWCQVRLIRVPPKYHQKYKHWQHKAFHYGAAINTAFRRAHGQFVIHVSADVFLTDECIRFIAKKNLDKSKFYRCDRYDVDSHVIREFMVTSHFSRSEFFSACGQNIKMHYAFTDPDPSFKIPNLHTNASGDFYLINREAIDRVRGYREGDDVGSLDVDGLLIHALYALGIEQEILPDTCRVYKGLHSNSTAAVVRQYWNFWQTALESALVTCGLGAQRIHFQMLFNFPKRRYSYAPKAIFDSYEANYIKVIRRWAKKRPPFYLNDANWGLVAEDLEEITLYTNLR